MSTSYPGSLDSLTNPSGTSLLTSPDHAQQHSDANDAIENIQSVLGTTAGTAVLREFTAGQVPLRLNSSGVPQQSLVGGTFVNEVSILGTGAAFAQIAGSGDGNQYATFNYTQWGGTKTWYTTHRQSGNEFWIGYTPNNSDYYNPFKVKALAPSDSLVIGTAGISLGLPITGGTITNPVLNGTLTGTGVVDEDTMSSNSDTKVPTQQSVKAYVDSGTATMTNKRITRRITSITSSGTPTPNADTDDMYIITAQAVAGTLGAPTGTPTTGQSLLLRIKDDGTARALSFNSGTGGYRAGTDVPLPTTTVASKTMYLLYVWNDVGTKWDLIDVTDNI